MHLQLALYLCTRFVLLPVCLAILMHSMCPWKRQAICIAANCARSVTVANFSAFAEVLPVISSRLQHQVCVGWVSLSVVRANCLRLLYMHVSMKCLTPDMRSLIVCSLLPELLPMILWYTYIRYAWWCNSFVSRFMVWILLLLQDVKSVEHCCLVFSKLTSSLSNNAVSYMIIHMVRAIFYLHPKRPQYLHIIT